MSAVLALGLACIALLVAATARIRARDLADRVAHLEALIAAGQGQAAPAPLAPPPALEPTPEPAPDSATDSATERGARPVARSAWTGRPKVARSADDGPRPAPAPSRLMTWLQANWIYPVAGVALVMAAIFLVQYSIEMGLLTPAMRIGLALALGAGLILVGEVIRRRFGAEDGSGGPLPSTLSGAGIAALFAAVLAAFHLYAMLGQQATLAALAAVALLALSLGWVHGPFLAALGIVAAVSAPFLLGESRAPKDLLYGYFTIVALTGLAIDGLRRWGWIGVLTVVATIVAIGLIREAGAGGLGLVGALMVIALAALTLPGGALIPRPAPLPPTRVDYPRLAALLALALSALLLVLRAEITQDSLALAALALLFPLWTRRAPALAGLVLIPVVALPAGLALDMALTPSRIPYALVTAPSLPLLVTGLAALAGLAMLWRSTTDEGRTGDIWALTGIGFPGAVLVGYTLFWGVGLGDDAWTWALTAIALATGGTAVALWSARRDAGLGLRLGAAAAAAFALIAFALMLLLSLSALTVALAVLMLAAAALDRRLDIPLLGWFQGLGAMALGWRLIGDPGLFWLLDPPESGGASRLDVALTLGASLVGPLGALALTRSLARGRVREWTRDWARDWARVTLETALNGIVPVTAVVILARFLPALESNHARAGILMLVLIAQAWVQARRAGLGTAGAPRLVRRLLAWLAAALATVLGLGLLSLLSPVFASWPFAAPVLGWPVFNDLILGYGTPGALLLWIGLRTPSRAVAIAGGLFLATWIALVIRHLWHGNAGMALRTGFDQGELYAYTVALLVAGATALALALRIGRREARLLGLGLIGVAAAKAFLIDASGLTGLLRVGAFLGLGLSLAGLAWLNGWVAARTGERGPAKAVASDEDQ